MQSWDNIWLFRPKAPENSKLWLFFVPTNGVSKAVAHHGQGSLIRVKIVPEVNGYVSRSTYGKRGEFLPFPSLEAFQFFAPPPLPHVPPPLPTLLGYLAKLRTAVLGEQGGVRYFPLNGVGDFG